MTRRRLVTGTIVVGLAIAAGVLILRERRPQLPAIARYVNLPASFNQALQRARDKIHSPAGEPDAVRSLAQLYQANRLFSEAKACYRVIASTAAGLSARDHYYLADIAESENDLPGAQAELRAVLRTEPGYAPARLALAEALFKTGREDEAAAEYSAILATGPNNPAASIGSARVALQRGDDAAAVARLESMVAAHPESASGAALLAQVLSRRGETDRANALTQRSQQIHEPLPVDPWLDALLVACYDVRRLALAAEQNLTAGQMDQALPYLDRIDELDPKSWIPPILRGWTHERAGDHSAAVREYRLALEKGGDPEKICPLLAAALLSLGDKAGATALLAEYRAKLPDSIPILRSSAEVAVRMGDDKLARELLIKVLQAEPYLYMPNMSLAGILWNAGERDQAAQCLLRVAKVFPADVDSRGLLGQYYLEKSDPSSAIVPLEQALANVGDNAPVRERLASMLTTAYLMAGSTEAEKGHFAEALAFSDQAIRISPAALGARALKANVLLHMKDFGRAAEVLEAVVSLEPGNPSFRLSLGDALYRNGEPDRARAQWGKARQLAAVGNDDLKAALDLRLTGQITDETFK
jgi:tetratricopeptide (TPR) repeat protein